jgi:predicted acylesterase/phospholipase RssA
MTSTKSRLECDLVMKGGITSGVIYPSLVKKLSEVYDFRSIGGTSAGAIAAGAAAAAQLGVLTGKRPDAFTELGELPKLLSGPANDAKGSMLLNLFQPQPQFRRHFALLKSGLNSKLYTPAALRISFGALWRFPIGAALGAAPGIVIACTSSGIASWIGIVLAVLGAVAGAAVNAGWSLAKHLPANYFGTCNGMPGKGRALALTPWLHEYLNGLAGKPVGEPLTFGELWAGRLRQAGESLPPTDAAPQIELAMMTTALNLGRPFRIPFESNVLYFTEEDLAPLLPREVVQWMIQRARKSATAERLSETMGRRFYSLPPPEDLPVLLGVRMSLSFPLLLSAIPLHSIDYTLAVNQVEGRLATRILFSDGGICSNFPVHFFDGALPSRPTFGVNLRPFHPEHPKERAWMPNPLENNRGVKTHIPELPLRPGPKSVLGFLGAIVSNMQNWRDQLQLGMPGFRDRIVHICHTEDEGGMNLDMDPEVIEALAGGGILAATKLREAFVPDPNGAVGGWSNHRRIRVRSLLAGIDHKLRQLDVALAREAQPSWAQIVLDRDASAYPFKSDEHRQLATELMAGLVQLGKRLQDSGIDLATGAPRPESEWRATPRV